MLFISFLIFSLLIAVDQITKNLVVRYIAEGRDIEVIKDFFYITYVENTGAAFGFLADKQWIFIIVAIVITLVGVVYYVRLPRNKSVIWQRVALVMIGAGAIGNLIDRLSRGFVVDMLQFIFWGHSFAVFNFADILVVLGTILLAGVIIVFSDEEKENAGV